MTSRNSQSDCVVKKKGLRSRWAVIGLSAGGLLVSTAPTLADGGLTGAAATASAIRISGMVGAGQLAPDSPEFASVLSNVQAGKFYEAALAAAQSKPFANAFARRFAKQMQNPAFDASKVVDNDATTFVVANLVNVNANAGLSKLFSDNATYLVNVTRAGVVSQQHVQDLLPAELVAVDFRTDLVRVAGQSAVDEAGKPIAIPAKHVGGYATLSQKPGDTSLAMYGMTAGTNLRMIESIWEIGVGLSLGDAASTAAFPQNTPRFVPASDPSFFRGEGQPACLSCHGGGLSSLTHGYQTVADTFDFDPKLGLVYHAAPMDNQRKSLGSNSGNRGATKTCNFTTFKTCNPDSVGVDNMQSWDLSATWAQTGVLAKLGWPADAVSGQGLNALGTAMGRSTKMFQQLTRRVIGEICPLGSLRDDEITAIAAEGQKTDDFKVIVARVASHASCR